MDHHSHPSVFFLPRHSQAPVQAFPHVISEPKKISKPLELAEPCSGLADSFHIDDLLDFTNEDIAGPIMDEPQPLQPPNSFINPCQIVETEKPNDGLSSISGVDDEDAKDLYFPCDDIAELEWLSNFVDDSFSTEDAAMPGLASVCVSLDTTESKHSSQLSYSSQDQFHVRSPVSVLESSASSGRGEMGSPSLIDMASTTNWAKTAIPAKARSKRTRNGLKVWPSQILTTPAVSETPSSTENSQQSTISWLDSIDGSVGNEISVDSKKQCRGFKKAGQDGQPRRCLHCLSQKTPQWRAGPLGPKTLCNACGVRYKSGRLFPEYRPALSPTFSVEKHSNSHRKVLEMRKMREFEPACDQPLLLNPPQHQEVGAILY